MKIPMLLAFIFCGLPVWAFDQTIDANLLSVINTHQQYVEHIETTNHQRFNRLKRMDV